MKRIFNSVFIFAAAATVLITGCKKDDDQVTVPPPVINGQEIINSLQLLVTDSATGNPVDTVIFLDPDGDGSGVPTIWDTLRLQASTTYLVDVILLNTLESPADTVSNEVANEADEHQFFFSFTGATITHTYLDNDGGTPPLPVGLINKFRTGVASTGTTQVILKHQPDGIKDGNVATGDTDIDVTFQTIIQ
ncbi:MAG: type 1 periplasmic binding fold superfamily protein [Bacteroidia bacterium]